MSDTVIRSYAALVRAGKLKLTNVPAQYRKAVKSALKEEGGESGKI